MADNSFYNSPGFAALINGAGGAFQAVGASKQNDANQKFAGQNNQIAANQGFEQADTQKALAAAGMNPLGQAQEFAARNRLMSAIMPNLRNSTLGGRTGGNAPLGANGLDPEMIQKSYGDQATLESLAQYAKQTAAVNPSAPQANYRNLGFASSQADPMMASVQDYGNQQQDKVSGYRSNIQNAINQQIQQQNQGGSGSGFWHQLAKYGGLGAAGLATVLSGGAASPLLLGILGAGGGAASAWGSGAGPAGVATAGAMGGLGAARLANGRASDANRFVGPINQR